MMVQEMEDVFVDLKASCAGAMASAKRVQRGVDEAGNRAADWDKKARLAVEKGREDLAREALLEKRRFQERGDLLEVQRNECEKLIDQYQNDITQLEAKMRAARERQKALVQRHTHARTKKRAQESIRRADSAGVIARVEGFEQRIDRMEAEADLVNYGRKPSLEEEFDRLEGDEQLEIELEQLAPLLLQLHHLGFRRAVGEEEGHQAEGHDAEGDPGQAAAVPFSCPMGRMISMQVLAGTEVPGQI